MKKLVKRMLVLIMGSILLVFAACNGNSGEKQEGNVDVVEDMNAYVYVPEFFPLDGVMGVNSYASTKDGLYLIAPFYDNATFTSGTEGYYVNGAGEMSKLTLKTENTPDSLCSIESVGSLSDGSLVFIKSEENVGDSSLPIGSKRFYLVHTQRETGEEIACVDITEKLQLSASTNGVFLRFLKVDKQDSIYVSDGQGMWMFDQDGELILKVATDPNGWIQDMGVTYEGQIVYASWDSASGGKCFYVIDETGALVTTCKENVPEANGSASMTQGIQKGILVNTLAGLVSYDITTETAETLLQWGDSKMSSDSLVAFTLLEDGDILALSINDENPEVFSYEAILLRKTLAQEVLKPENRLITLGIFGQNTALTRYVTLFNQSQEEYWVEIVDYNESGDFEGNLLRFKNELIAGGGPDVFDVSNLDLKQLAKEGFIEELSPYFAQGEGFQLEDYFPSVVNAYAVDGGIYTIPNNFSVVAVAGSEAYLAEYGSDYSWTLDEILALAKENPEKEMYGYGSKNYVLLNSVRYNYNQFIDWESGNSYFNDDSFLKLLEFANTFPSQYEGNNEVSITDKMLNGTLMVDEISLSSIQSYQIQEALFGENFIVKGFPTEEGTGLAVSGNNMLVMNASAEEKDDIWEFMRSLLTEETYDKEKVYGLPTLIPVYDKINQQYMTPEYEKDENGNQVESSKGSYSIGNFSIDFRTSSKEEEAWMRDIIEQCDRAFLSDGQIETILKEEAAAYFNGEKSAAEVADIIQNRVEMYVNENS